MQAKDAVTIKVKVLWEIDEEELEFYTKIADKIQLECDAVILETMKCIYKNNIWQELEERLANVK